MKHKNSTKILLCIQFIALLIIAMLGVNKEKCELMKSFEEKTLELKSEEVIEINNDIQSSLIELAKLRGEAHLKSNELKAMQEKVKEAYIKESLIKDLVIDYGLDYEEIRDMSKEELEVILKYREDYDELHSLRLIKYPENTFSILHYYYLSQACNEFRVPIEGMLSLIELESSFDMFAFNRNNSTADGYGQILNSTGEWLWYLCGLDKLYGEYEPSKKFIAHANLVMSTKYISVLRDSRGSFSRAFKGYYGHKDPAKNEEYLKMIAYKLKRYDMQLWELDSRTNYELVYNSNSVDS